MEPTTTRTVHDTPEVARREHPPLPASEKDLRWQQASRNPRFRLALIVGGIVLLVAGFFLWRYLGSYESTDDAQVDGQLLSDEVVANVVTLLLTAGLDTVVAMLGFFVRFLALNPAHRRQLIEEPACIQPAVEELLRRFAIVTLAREVTCDVEIRGIGLKRGDMISVPTILANLDEDAFDDPLSVNFRRRTIPHLTFGGGPHRCMGAMLARTELQIFLQEWLARIPDFSIRPDFDVKVRSRVVTTIPALPLVWAAAT